MKRLVFAVLLAAGVATSAVGQETYSLAASAPQVARLTRAVTISNNITCLRFNQLIGCTQAQACVGASATGGAACTAAQARATGARIYPQTLAGREEFLTFALIVPGVADLIHRAVAFDQEQFCTLFKASSVANQNAACTAIGYTAGCEPCP